MITTQAFPTIRAIQRDAWNDCFPDALEDWDYYVAVQNAGIEDFTWRYLAVFEDGALVAALSRRSVARGKALASRMLRSFRFRLKAAV